MIRDPLIGRRLPAFLIAGGVGFACNAGLLLVLDPLIGPFFAQMIAFPASLWAPWLINSRYTFNDRRYPGVMQQSRYIGSSVASMLVINATYVGLVMVGLHPLAGLFVAALVGAMTTYALLDCWVFRARTPCR